MPFNTNTCWTTKSHPLWLAGRQQVSAFKNLGLNARHWEFQTKRLKSLLLPGNIILPYSQGSYVRHRDKTEAGIPCNQHTAVVPKSLGVTQSSVTSNQQVTWRQAAAPFPGSCEDPQTHDFPYIALCQYPSPSSVALDVFSFSRGGTGCRGRFTLLPSRRRGRVFRATATERTLGLLAGLFGGAARLHQAERVPEAQHQRLQEPVPDVQHHRHHDTRDAHHAAGLKHGGLFQLLSMDLLRGWGWGDYYCDVSIMEKR